MLKKGKYSLSKLSAYTLAVIITLIISVLVYFEATKYSAVDLDGLIRHEFKIEDIAYEIHMPKRYRLEVKNSNSVVLYLPDTRSGESITIHKPNETVEKSYDTKIELKNGGLFRFVSVLHDSVGSEGMRSDLYGMIDLGLEGKYIVIFGTMSGEFPEPDAGFFIKYLHHLKKI